jgi:hypothetical protein
MLEFDDETSVAQSAFAVVSSCARVIVVRSTSSCAANPQKNVTRRAQPIAAAGLENSSCMVSARTICPDVWKLFLSSIPQKLQKRRFEEVLLTIDSVK